MSIICDKVECLIFQVDCYDDYYGKIHKITIVCAYLLRMLATLDKQGQSFS